MSILYAILIFGLIITVHEIGHFLAARASGVMVLEFALGMGPKIIGIQKGETLYSLRLFPIGGFCKMLGEEEGSKDPRALCNKSIFKRFCVFFGGSFMNFLLAFIVFFFIVMSTGIIFPEIQEILPGMPAEAQGLMPGDRIIGVNNTRVFIYDDFSFAISNNPGSPVDLTIRRNRQVFTVNITPRFDENTGRFLIGFRPLAKLGLFMEAEPDFLRASIFEIIYTAFFNIIFWIKSTFIALIRLVTFRLSVNEIAGPIGIVQVIGTTYSETRNIGVSVTIRTMAHIMALISANIGVINLLPLPALDGGRLVFLTLEGIRRKPLNPDKEGMVHFIGFVALMVFAVFLAYNDIRRFL